jgi:hypothetical protein
VSWIKLKKKVVSIMPFLLIFKGGLYKIYPDVLYNRYELYYTFILKITECPERLLPMLVLITIQKDHPV